MTAEDHESTAQSVPVVDMTFARIRAELWKQGVAIVLAGVGLLATTGGAFYVKVQTDQARAEEVHNRLERDVEALERDLRDSSDALDELQGDVRALKAAYESGQADTRSRLVRIEAALDRR